MKLSNIPQMTVEKNNCKFSVESPILQHMYKYQSVKTGKQKEVLINQQFNIDFLTNLV